MTTLPPDPRDAPGLRLGDPLRRAFLEHIEQHTLVPRLLSRERLEADADLTVALSRGPEPELVLAAGSLTGGKRWVLRQPLGSLRSGDLAEARRAELVAAGHPDKAATDLAERSTRALLAAIVAALEELARLRPEHALAPRSLARDISHALAGSELADGRATERDDGPHESGRHEEPSQEEHAEVEEYEEEEGPEEWDDEDVAAADTEDWEDEDDAEDGEEEDEDPGPLAASAPTRRPRWRRRVVAALVVGAVVAAAVSTAGARRPSADEAADPGPDPTTPVEAPVEAAPATPPTTFTVHLRNADGTAVRFDPCSIHEFVVQPGGLGPEVAAAEAGAGVAALEEATGLAFRFAGLTTDTFPFPIPQGETPRSPILISYEDPEVSRPLREGAPELGTHGRPLGGLTAAGPVTVRPGFAVLDGGVVVINESLVPEQRLRVLLHELGHVAGLAHPSDPGQLMATPVPESGPTAYRDGDRAGLAEVGAAAGCVVRE